MNIEVPLSHASSSLPPPIGQAGSTSGAGVNPLHSRRCHYCNHLFNDTIGGSRATKKALKRAMGKTALKIHPDICVRCISKKHPAIPDHPARATLKKFSVALTDKKIDPIASAADIAKAIADGRGRISEIDSRLNGLMEEIAELTNERNVLLRSVLDVEWFFELRDGETYESRRKEADKAIKKELTRLHVLSRDGNRCVGCGTKDDLTIDHILAVKRGGANDIVNLQTLCRSCNSRKGARPWVNPVLAQNHLSPTEKAILRHEAEQKAAKKARFTIPAVDPGHAEKSKDAHA